MLNMLGFFNLMLYLQSTQTPSMLSQNNIIEQLSFPFHSGMMFLLATVYCYQIFYSYEQYMKYRMTSKQRERVPQSVVQKLEHDENNPDRANYHPVYVLVYLMYYFMMQLSMVLGVLFPSFAYGLQLCLFSSLGYFILIILWNPYHQLVRSHNLFLKLNHGSMVLLLIIFQTFVRFDSLPNIYYILMMHLIVILITVIMIGGFLRIVIQKRFRKRFQENNIILYQSAQQDQLQINVQNIGFSEQLKSPQMSKRSNLLQNNDYVFQNQLKKMIRNRKQDLETDQFSLNIKEHNINTFNEKEKEYLMNKIRKDYQRQRQDIVLEQFIQNHLKHQRKKIFQQIMGINSEKTSALSNNDQKFNIQNLNFNNQNRKFEENTNFHHKNFNFNNQSLTFSRENANKKQENRLNKQEKQFNEQKNNALKAFLLNKSPKNSGLITEKQGNQTNRVQIQTNIKTEKVELEKIKKKLRLQWMSMGY